MQDCSNRIEDLSAECFATVVSASSSSSKSCLVLMTQVRGNRKLSTILRQDRPNLTIYSVLPENQFPPKGSLRPFACAKISVLWCLAAFMLYPAVITRSREPHGRCAIGAIPILQISWVAGKIPGATAVPSRFQRQVPVAHEYCSKDRDRASAEPHGCGFQPLGMGDCLDPRPIPSHTPFKRQKRYPPDG
jgi:hypothetical protein